MVRRCRSSLLPLAVIAGAVVAMSSPPVHAELDNGVFTSLESRLRIVVPRGWRASDQPSYPGLLLWMMRNQPEGKIVLTAEPFTRAVYCGWPLACRTSPDPLPAKLACALRTRLAAQRLRVGPIQAGPKENERSGIPSVWFELDDGKRFLRQAVALDEDHVFSLVLSAGSAEARAAHVRAFDQALRTLRPLTAEEVGLPTPAAPASGGASAPAAATVASGDASTPAAATVASGTASVAELEPVGPCAQP